MPFSGTKIALFCETAQKREEKVRGKWENEGKSREIGPLSAEKCRKTIHPLRLIRPQGVKKNFFPAYKELSPQEGHQQKGDGKND